MFRRMFTMALFVSAMTLVVSAPASATTFCVPGYFTACPNSGGNVAQANLDSAASANGNDGVPDRIILDAFTWTGPTSLGPVGTDPLEIVGSGTDKTVITTSTSSNVYVVTSGNGDRELTLRDLTVMVPKTVPNNGGAGIFMKDGHLVNVDIDAHKSASVGLQSAGDTTYEGGRIFESEGTSMFTGVSTSGFESGTLRLEGVTIDGPIRGVESKAPGERVVLSRSRVLRPEQYGVMLYGGGSVDVDNSVVESGSSTSFYAVSAAGGNTKLNIDSSTVVSAGHPTVPAIDGTVQNQNSYGSIRIKVRNSIFRDFNSTYDLTAPAGNGNVGDTNISFEYSNFNLFGTQTGDGTAYIPANNINQDPLFSAAGDYSLTAGSPSIDAGDPDPIDGPSIDILGAPRPFDGNGDGNAIQDQGAYESGATVPCGGNAAICPSGDKTAPKVTKVKFKAAKKPKKGYTLSMNLSEAAKVKATFKPTGNKKPKRKTVKLTKQAKSGANTIKVGSRKLKPGAYRLSIIATDGAGNRSKVVRKVKVKAP